VQRKKGKADLTNPRATGGSRQQLQPARMQRGEFWKIWVTRSTPGVNGKSSTESPDPRDRTRMGLGVNVNQAGNKKEVNDGGQSERKANGRKRESQNCDRSSGKKTQQ